MKVRKAYKRSVVKPAKRLAEELDRLDRPKWKPLTREDVIWASQEIMGTILKEQPTAEDKLLAALFLADIVRMVK